MKTLNILIFFFLAATANADEVRRMVDANPDGLVHIINTAGSIEVSGWSRNSVEVVADLGKNVDELIVEQDGDEVIVKVKLPRRDKTYRGTSTDLVIHVPQNSALKVAGVSADVAVSDVLGSLQLQSVSGDIEVDAFSADIDVETVSGDIDMSGEQSRMRTRATSVSGDVELSGLAGEVEARSVSGDVTIVSGSFSRAELNTTNGDIVLKAELLESGRLDVETINGEVEMDFVGALSARFDIETFNGSIDSCFGPQPERTNRYAPGRQLIFNEGSGSARAVVRTLNGDIRMCND